MSYSKLKIKEKLLVIVLTAAMLLPMTAVNVSVAVAATDTADYIEYIHEADVEISLAADTKNIEVVLPTDKTKTELSALLSDTNNKVIVNLIRDESKPYVDEELYPNQKDGGAMNAEDSVWETQKTEDQNDASLNNQFTNFSFEAVANAETGKADLKVKFDSNVYFYDRKGNADYSAPHSNGGAYLDICGYFNISVTDKDGNAVTKASKTVKVIPYEGFHTMYEIYDEITKVAAKATENGLFAKEYSMGTSTGGRNMPYLIIAGDEADVDNWLAFTEKAETDPKEVLDEIKAGKYNDIKVPVLYSNIHANEVAAADGIMNFAWMLANEGAGGTLPYNKLTGFTEEGETQLAAERANLAIPELVAADSTCLGYIKSGNKKSEVVDLDKYYTQDTITVSIDAMLDDVFFILVPEENVDGRTFITRTAENGYDLNRDNSFQTTSETQNMQKLIGTFNPVSFTEFHGRVSTFQCEPCDPPHEPNFEYDLLSKHLMKGGEALGIAAVANNSMHNSYVIPQRDYLDKTSGGGTEWSDPWDDMSTSYTPQFAMLQGTVAYTVELPAYNTESAKAVSYGILGQADYIANAKLEYLKCQTEIFERGVTNFNSDAYELVGQWFADQNDKEGAEAEIFRPEYDGEGENGNFYPECYIIPLDSENQKNVQAAADMLELLTRNDVKINIAAKSFTYDGVEYPKGTVIVSMYQAKRSVANGLLYDGTLITNWTVLYSEGITTFNETRGFDMETVAKPAAYTKIKEAMGASYGYEQCTAYLSSLASSFKGIKGADVIIKNVNESSTSAVNKLLKDGKTVSMITKGSEKGNFICSYKDYLTVCNDYILDAQGVSGSKYTAKAIKKAPTVYITGVPSANGSGYIGASKVSSSNWNYDRVAMELMNFNVTTDVTKADIIVGASALNSSALAAVKSGTPYIGYSSSAVNGYKTLFGTSLVRSSCKGAMDCLGSVTYPNETMTNATYISEGDNIMYGYGVGYFSQIPEGAVELVKMDGSKEPTEGFIPMKTDAQKESYKAYINGSVQAFEYEGKDAEGNDIDVAVFANTLTNKVHQRDEYSFISNFIFSNMLEEDIVKVENGKADVPAGIIDDASKDADKEVVVSIPKDEAVSEITLPVSSVKEVADANKSLTIETKNASVTLDSKALAAVISKADGDKITLKVEAISKDKLDPAQKKAIEKYNIDTIISAEILCGDKVISSDFGGGKATVKLQFTPAEGKKLGDYTIVYIADDGKLEKIPTKVIDGALAFEIEHFSEYAVALSADVTDIPMIGETPKTGDASDLGGWAMLALAALAAVGAVVFLKKKETCK